MPRFMRHICYLAGFSLAMFAYTGGAFAAPPTSQPSPASAQPAGGATPLSLTTGSMGTTIKSLFGPKTEEDYFSPFDIMNPAHIRADMPLQIGGVERPEPVYGPANRRPISRRFSRKMSPSAAYNSRVSTPDSKIPSPASRSWPRFPDKLDVYFDLYIASRPHPNTMYAHEGYLLFKQLPAPFDSGALGRYLTM
jgi:hypothetical protein